MANTGYLCTFHSGSRETEAYITNINQEDIDWFTENNAVLSAESHQGVYIFYADVGLTLEDDETPRKAIIAATDDDDPFVKFGQLRQQAQNMLEEVNGS